MINEYLSIIFFDSLKILALLVPVLIAVALIVWVDRRVWGLVQLRKGPNVVGPFGLLQTAADALKYIFKEIIIPAGANKVIFILAPVVTMSLALLAWAVIPFGEDLFVTNINVGILYLFAVSSLGVYGIIMAGWASNSKYPFLGALRSAAQMVSYEVSIGFIIVTVLLCVGSLNLVDIVLAQKKHLVCYSFISYVCNFFYICFSGNKQTSIRLTRSRSGVGVWVSNRVFRNDVCSFLVGRICKYFIDVRFRVNLVFRGVVISN